jgi:hypothetical protein
MRQGNALISALVPALAAAAVFSACATPNGARPLAGSSETSATTDSTPPPMSGPPVTLSTEITSSAGFSLSPPPNGSTPGISAGDALANAWAAQGAEGDPTADHLTYAFLTWEPNYDQSPIWLVTYEGTCIPIDGGVGATHICRKIPFYTFVDADTGAFIAAFADSSLNI